MQPIKKLNILKNLLLNNRIKSYIRVCISKQLFILDNNTEFNTLNKLKEKKIIKEGDSLSNNLNVLKHKRLNSLILKTNIISNNISNINNTTLKSLRSVIKTQKNSIKSLKILKPVKHGFYVISNEGIIGFLHKTEIIKILLLISMYFKKTRLELKDFFFRSGQHRISKTLPINLFGKLNKVKFHVSKIKRSSKYFIPKHSGKFKISYKHVIETTTK
jgi:hypothetical protein